MPSPTPPPPATTQMSPPPPRTPLHPTPAPLTRPTAPPPIPPRLPPPLPHLSSSTVQSLPQTPFTSSTSSSPTLPLPSSPLARSRSTRKPRVPTSPPPTASATDRELLNALRQIGYTQYYELFAHHRLTSHTLRDFTSKQLRDDLNIRPLRHRREIARILNPTPVLTPAQQVPDFGRILVHLSNVRTFHSWLVSGMQLVVFAMSIIRIAPAVRGPHLLAAGGTVFVCVGVLLQVYGVVRYWAVMKALERGADFRPDTTGTSAMLVLALSVAGLVLYVLLKDGFGT